MMCIKHCQVSIKSRVEDDDDDDRKRKISLTSVINLTWLYNHFKRPNRSRDRRRSESWNPRGPSGSRRRRSLLRSPIRIPSIHFAPGRHSRARARLHPGTSSIDWSTSVPTVEGSSPGRLGTGHSGSMSAGHKPKQPVMPWTQ